MMKSKLGLWVVLVLFGALLFALSGEAVVECWRITTATNCGNNATSSGCIWNTAGSFCDRASCYSGDSTNQSHCMVTLNQTYNLSCVWQLHGTNLCDPSGGSFFGGGCSDFNGNSVACFGAVFCDWNATSSTCTETGDFSFGGGMGGFKNPSCSALMDSATCANITGCTWNTYQSSCSGNADGVQCNQVNKTICNEFTMLSTCCSWNGTGCTTSFGSSCYDTMTSLPSGATFCEDVLAYTNQTLCNQIAGNPWYMPCKWNNVTNECHFNDAAFGGGGVGGGFADFDEIGTQMGCEAQNGIWKTEQYISGGSIKSDSWCEFKFGFEFGGGGNCNSACWACEAGVSTALGNNTDNAQYYCQNSALGYCEFKADSNAPNGLGWCNPKNEFVEGGGKSCKDDCGACDFLTSPQAQCQNSTKLCTWVADNNASNGVGYCYGQNEKRCGNDCFSCYDSSSCANKGKGGSGACTWDPVSLLCKDTGFTGEICFDGKDNDNDGLTDCGDPGCATDKFCGGASLSQSFGANCPAFSTNATCTAGGCAWLGDSFGGGFGGSFTGHCDFPGAQCVKNGAETPCTSTSGCSWVTAASQTCGKNETLFDSCFSAATAATCNIIPGCGWSSDPYSGTGRCEPLVFAQCFGNSTRHQNRTNCEINDTVRGSSTQICAWTADMFSPQGGFCDPVCMSKGGTNDSCSYQTSGLCGLMSGYCSPNSFGGKCNDANGNQTKCTGVYNATCTWNSDPNANNNVSLANTNSGNTSGWCNPKNAAGFMEFMGEVKPISIGSDDFEAGVNDSYDIGTVYIRNEFDRVVFGTALQDGLANSSICNGVPLTGGGSGGRDYNHTFFWYLDSDGNTTNNCAARDNSSVVGYEFSFKYLTSWSGTASSPTEKKVSYRCVNGSWGATPIPLSSSKQKVCKLIGGGMAGIEKKEMYKFSNLFNKSKEMRIYVTVGNSTSNDSQVLDFGGPFYYSQDSMDFEFEDCGSPGADADGDGITSSNDPDCFDFLKFGFKPSEAGFQCGDGKDNDGDGKTDCVDEGCKYDPFICGGQLVADANDKTAPKVIWLQKDTYPSSAFVMYDTDEPANGTLLYYYNDSSCGTVNKTIRDVGLTDNFIPDYKLWHDGPIDTASFNMDAISKAIPNATTFYFKTKVCDVSSNCAESACINATTKTVMGDCKSCKSTFNFPFTPPTGASATDPTGNLSFLFDFQDGTSSNGTVNAEAGVQLNFTQLKSFNLKIVNPTADNVSKWSIKLINASVNGKVSAGIQNFSGGADVQYNSTTNGSFVGLGNTKCQELINTFRPKKLEIGIPGNHTTELWQCSGALANCTNKASNATSLGYNATLNTSFWVVPAEWGC